jgi:hypothetical protein
MYAPVCTRLLTYDVAIDAISAGYCRTIMALAHMQQWIAAANRNPMSLKNWTWSFEPRANSSAFAPNRLTAMSAFWT